MSIRVQWRRGTAAQWTSANPTLAAGEAGFENDTGKFKIGDGATAWSDLEYTGSAADVAAAQAAAQAASDSATAAAASASASAASATTAEGWADAAQASGSIYASTAAGLAATVDGEYFSVPSADADEYLILYKNVSEVATEVKRYPSADRVTALEGRTEAVEAVIDSFILGPDGKPQMLHAFAIAKAAVAANASDVNILVIGDSTGDATAEWVYLFSQWLGTKHPTHTVEYYGWNDAITNYGAATVLSAGTGTWKIKVWNASLSGSQPGQWMGARYANAIQGKSANLVIWNHGHNVAIQPLSQVMEGAFAPWIERVQLEYPDAGLAITSQNPRRDDSLYADRDAALRSLVEAKDRALLLDVYGRFLELGKPSSLYTDNLHPNAAGEAEWADVVKAIWSAAAKTAPPPPQPWVAMSGTNLLTNGDFAAFAGALPDGWTKGGTGSVTKDTTTVDSGSTYSVRIENTGASATYLVSDLDASGRSAAIAAGSISLAIRRFVNNPAVARVGYVTVLVRSTSEGDKNYSLYPDSYNPCTGEWHWNFIRAMPVPSDTTKISVAIYASNIASAGPVANFDRVVVVAGSQPADAA